MSVSKYVAKANGAVRHSTRFQSNSADDEFGCMLRMNNGVQINDDGCFGADQWDGCWDVGIGLLVLLGAIRTCVVLWFGWLQGVSVCIDSHA